MKKIFSIVGFSLAFGWQGLGCGPCKSTSLIIRADTTLHKAKAVDADKKAPYEYTAAYEYLHKAREKWGTSDFEYSIDYAAKAQDLATQALEQSLKKHSEE